MSNWTTDDVEFMDEGELKEALATLGVTVAGNESVDELRQKALEALPKEELKKPSDPKSTAPSVAEVDAMKAQLQQSGQELPGAAPAADATEAAQQWTENDLEFMGDDELKEVIVANGLSTEGLDTADQLKARALESLEAGKAAAEAATLGQAPTTEPSASEAAADTANQIADTANTIAANEIPDIAAILFELGLGEKVAAAGRWCKEMGAESLGDLEGENYAEELAERLAPPPITKAKLVARLKGEEVPPAGADIGALLAELKLDAKVEAAKKWCAEVGATSTADLEGEYVEQFVAALEPLPPIKKTKLTELLADTEKLAALAAVAPAGAFGATAALRDAFAAFDANNDGFLSVEELTGILTRPGGGAPMTEEQAKAFVAKHDKNGDGKLDLDEFAAALAAEQAEREGAAGGDPAAGDGPTDAQILDAVDAGALDNVPDPTESIEVGGMLG